MRKLGQIRWSTPPRDEEMFPPDLRLYPGATLPFGAKEFEPMFVDIPASTAFPCDFSVTRWPEGAEL